jgi:hypothetical protein
VLLAGAARAHAQPPRDDDLRLHGRERLVHEAKRELVRGALRHPVDRRRGAVGREDQEQALGRAPELLPAGIEQRNERGEGGGRPQATEQAPT